jgi:hypothetical protein
VSDKSVCKEEPELIICTKKEEIPETLLVLTMSKKNHIHTCNKGIIFLLDVIISGGQFGLVIN